MIRQIFLTLLAIFFLSSCATKALWGDKKYEENVTQFFSSNDGRYVVFIGSKYHYVFTDNSGLLRKILMLKQKNILIPNPAKTYLDLGSNNDVKGFFVIEGPASILPPEDSGILKAAGIFPDKYDNISVKIKLSGRRYAPRYLGQSIANLATSYTIPVYYSDSNLIKDVGKAAVTPVAVGLDAVLLIGKVVLFPFTAVKGAN